MHGSDVFPASPVGEPLVIAGLTALAARRARKGAALGRRALTAFDAWGASWDKRLGLERWRALAELLVRDGDARDRELDRAARRAKVALEHARGSPERIWTQLDAVHAFASCQANGLALHSGTLPPPEPRSLRFSSCQANGLALHSGTLPPPEPRSLRFDAPWDDRAAMGPVAKVERGGGSASPADSLPPRFARYIAGLRTNTERPVLQFYPGLRTLPWHDPREHPIVADLERLAPVIAEEARALEMARFQDEAEDIGRTGRWSVLFLHELGRPNEENLARCPTTASIVDKHRTITTSTGLIYFSSLDPQTRVAPHQGPTNLRLRCHLGLEVPESCGMRVGGVTGSWEEGRCVVFDDSFWHEVWNESDRRRLVLILDLWHPDLSDDEVSLLSGLQRYGMVNASATRRGLARNDAARGRTNGTQTGKPRPEARPSAARKRG
jgi:aspartate beta-hydroxylase